MIAAELETLAQVEFVRAPALHARVQVQIPAVVCDGDAAQPVE
jgi:hypothetical protein